MTKIQVNQLQTESLEQDSLSLKWIVISLALVSAVILILIGIFSGMDSFRQRQVVTEQTNVAKQFIAQNHGQVEAIFNRTFDECQKDLDAKIAGPTPSPGIDYQNMGRWSAFSCESAKQAFNSLNKDALKDFPSTGYIRVKDKNVELLEASGDYFRPQPIKQLYQLSHQDDLETFLFRHEPIRQWNTFLNYMQQRQVIVPIEQNNQIIGYMFIGVIEK
jgi:hypothetical protein